MRAVFRLFLGLGMLAVVGVQPSGRLLAQHLAQPAPPAGSVTPAMGKPNIILIVADDLGYGDLGCYGQTRIKTPNLDRMAEEGMRFTQFYAGSTVCAPSRCALMTGYHTGHCRVRGNGRVPLQPEDVTVAEVLRATGYRTGIFGKWGLGTEDTTGRPDQQGFEEILAYLDQTHAHDYYTDRLWRRDVRVNYNDWMTFYENQGGYKRLYSHDLFTQAALNYIRVNKPEPHTHYRPFFLYLAYTIPHANNEEGTRTGNGMEVPSADPYAGESWPAPERNKAAMITRLDADIGRLLDLLKRLKIDENTLVLFTSDNGPHAEGGVDPAFFRSAGPLRGRKRDLTEGGIRVPLLARWPGQIAPGKVQSAPFAFWDFLPTAAELAGATPPKGLDGISFLPALTGGRQTNQHDYLYWEFHERGFAQAVRSGPWKGLRRSPEAPLELYNLETDPGEKEDVAAQNPNEVARIKTLLARARTDSEHWPGKKEDSTPSPAGKKQEASGP